MPPQSTTGIQESGVAQDLILGFLAALEYTPSGLFYFYLLVFLYRPRLGRRPYSRTAVSWSAITPAQRKRILHGGLRNPPDARLT